MKQCKMTFRFTFNNGSIMETTHISERYETKQEAESRVWRIMSENNFSKNLILDTEKIEKISTEFF